MGPHCLPLLALVIYAANDINRCHFQVEIMSSALGAAAGNWLK